MCITDKQYEKLLTKAKLVALSPTEVAKDYEEDNTEWYNVKIAEIDFPTLVDLENLKWYSFCRCHITEEDGSTSKEHMHALVKFVGHPNLKEFRKIKKLHKGTVFKKILCLDHAVGVLHYLCCDRGRKSYRGDAVHSHYCQAVYDNKWLHKRSPYRCGKIRNAISEEAAKGSSHLEYYTSPHVLHDFEYCPCDYGSVSVGKKILASYKRKCMQEQQNYAILPFTKSNK